ncbi:MFS siderochrome iron transporter 1 [Friedmanniomyces endolithicus]|nr:MFS siderochrome iron transporter 1 [Friedmanniomyces endolithicus]
MAEKDVEAGKPTRIPHMRQVFDQSGVTPEVANHSYDGSGTEDDPYVVTWIEDDPRNPMLYSNVKKWSLTMLVAIATLAVAFVSSAYSGGAKEVIRELQCSQEIYTLGLTFFVLGFAIGPLLWAPLSELFGRQVLYVTTYGALTAFNAGAAGSQNIATLIVLRFLAGAFGSSPLTNAGGVIADMFAAKQRGLAMALFAAAPFMGPVLGPIVGGFVGETIGWRWVEGIMAIFTGALWILGALFLPETYPPVILRKRAAKLSKMTGKVYRSQGDVEQGPTTFGHVFKTSLSRPWILLFREPIVLLLSIYMAIIYGTLYMLFSAFPIVYQQNRGWSAGIGGLAFLGVVSGRHDLCGSLQHLGQQTLFQGQ